MDADIEPPDSEEPQAGGLIGNNNLAPGDEAACTIGDHTPATSPPADGSPAEDQDHAPSPASRPGVSRPRSATAEDAGVAAAADGLIPPDPQPSGPHDWAASSHAEDPADPRPDGGSDPAVPRPDAAAAPEPALDAGHLAYEQALTTFADAMSALSAAESTKATRVLAAQVG